MSVQRAKKILGQLSVPEPEMDQEMIETTIGFLAAFDRLDRDKNGSLTKEEFREAVKRLNPTEDPNVSNFDHGGREDDGAYLPVYSLKKHSICNRVSVKNFFDTPIP